jgi:hypothetical protein
VLLEILKALVTAPGCPRPAILIAANNIYRVLDMPFVHRMATVGQLDLDPVKIKIDQLMGMNIRECFAPITMRKLIGVYILASSLE